jgi:uncharacterized iron-regulated membrane protein
MLQTGIRSSLYRTIWRWHFYAGLFIIPMILVLSVTGATYLFKPQIDRWEERAFQSLPTGGKVSPSAQRDAALAAFPGARFLYYRLPDRVGDAALVHVALPGRNAMRDVFVSPQGHVLGALDPDRRIMETISNIHGQLLLGHRGSWLVELAASWAIVLIATGLYLWWPRGARFAGVLWPRLGRGRRVLLRDLHAVTGFWVGGFALVLLVTGLPWADVWGSGFKAIRAELGLVKGEQDWTIGGRPADGGEHAKHMDGGAMAGAHHSDPAGAMPMHGHAVGLDRLVAQAEADHLAFPVLVAPPDLPSSAWTVRSDSQNRPLRTKIEYDPSSGRELSRETFADKHVIDRVVGYGVAWHEGQLFGWVNQLVGTITALALMTLAVTGFLSWRRRKPDGRIGVPSRPEVRVDGWGVRLAMGFFLLTLPMFTLSLLVLWLFDRFALPRLPSLSRWLGMPAATRIDLTAVADSR